MSATVELSKEAALRSREALRLLGEENEDLRKQVTARKQLSKEAAARLAAALVTSGHVRPADQAKTASTIENDPDAILNITERMAAELAAPPSVGGPDAQTKSASEKKETAAEVWERGMSGIGYTR
jgi:hypothetical protein